MQVTKRATTLDREAQTLEWSEYSRIADLASGALEGRAPLVVDVGDESGYSALFILACAGKLGAVTCLVAAGADVAQATKRGKTPIYGAVEKCHTDVVEFLMPRYSANQLRANTTYGEAVGRGEAALASLCARRMRTRRTVPRSPLCLLLPRL